MSSAKEWYLVIKISKMPQVAISIPFTTKRDWLFGDSVYNLAMILYTIKLM